MKKDNHQPDSEPTGEPITSSMRLVLQQLNKEAEKKEAAAESAKIRCRICFKETAPTPRCFGHGGGGGGGDGSGSDNSSEDKAGHGDDKSLIKTDHLVDDSEELIGEVSFMEDSEELIEDGEELDPESQSEERSFDPDVIAELVAEELLVINNDRKSMTLTIDLQCEPDSLSEKQREELEKFMQAILKEFNTLKEKHHLSDDCLSMTRDEKGNIVSLRVSLPTLKLYDEFIQRLANNLLPTPTPKLQTEDKDTKNLAPTPLSMKPKPTAKNKPIEQDVTTQDEELSKETAAEDEQGIFKLSPFSIKMDPW